MQGQQLETVVVPKNYFKVLPEEQLTTGFRAGYLEPNYKHIASY
jgi:hypothetical protein